MKKILTIVAAAWMIMLCAACRSEVEVVERVKIDSVYVTKIDSVVRKETVRDTCYVKDSMWIEWMEDTCYVDRWHYVYKEKVRVDTLWRNNEAVEREVRVDSVPVPYEVVVEKRDYATELANLVLGILVVCLVVVVIWQWVKNKWNSLL